MNYDRYKKYTEEEYNKKSISSFFMKNQCDKILFPYIDGITGKEILEVGLGYGGYTKRYMDKNNVSGMDINSDMGKDIGISIIQGKADQIREKVNKKYDYILSFFMTEYLASNELEQFMEQAVEALKPGGTFATTIIWNRGIGWLYIALARIKGIKKYNYSIDAIKEMISGKNINITKLNSVLHIPFALLLEIKQ
ncbi:MAG: class I SAM-dependent methyltransferase [Lachnospiraceae bacterium]|nr:class I SAM-dependent methyltransferase [Lachnospiraceae bacterium]